MGSPSQVSERVTLLPRSRAGFAWLQKQTALLALALFLATLILYYPVHHYPFIDIDDNFYVTENPHVLGPLNFSALEWAFTHPYVLNYDPLTFLSHSLDVQVFGLDAGRHHDVNAILHALNAVLLFWVLKRATGYTLRSFMVAALFALHPIQVENVAWISERKTMLSTLFFFLALGAYRWFARDPRLRRMAVVALFYGLGLLAKPQVITLPFVLLLWDYWPLRRMFPGGPDLSAAPVADVIPPRTSAVLVREKIPLFAIAALDVMLTMVAQHVSSTQRWPYTLSIRVANAVVAYAEYLGKAFWPTGLALEYLYRGNSLKWWEVLGASSLLLVISAFVAAQRRHRYLVVGWLWFLGTLVPMIGLVVQPDLEALADRYAYVSFIGLFLMVCWGAAEWAEQPRLPRVVLPVASLAVLLILSVLTHRQVGYWSDRVTLWTHTLEVTHHNWVAESRLGVVYRHRGQTDEALASFQRAEEDHPGNPSVNLNLGLIEHERGNLTQAIPYYEKVLAVSDDQAVKAQVLGNLGHIYSALGDDARARECYQAALHPPAAPRPAIDWHGEWWRDIGPFLRQYLQK